MSTSIHDERLLPSLVDEIAQTDPNRVLFSINKTPDPSDGFRDVDARSFAAAVNRCAWYLEEQLGGRGQNFPTLLYLGPQDLVYGILTLAAIKAGYKLLLNSPRNSLEAHLKLLEATECNTFLMPPVFPLPVVKQILSNRQMKVVEIAPTQQWLDGGDVAPYPYTKTFAEARHEPFVVLHTSGSTGWPKPIVQTHGTHTPMDAYKDIPSMGLQPVFPTMCTGQRVYSAFPLFHCAGLFLLLAASLYNEFTVVLAPFPPSPDVVNKVHTHANVQTSCLPTAILIGLCKDPESLNNLSRLKLVIYGGGPCPQRIGELASTKTRIASVLGTTEIGVPPNLIVDPEDWAYLGYSPAMGNDFRPYGDGLYEHFIVRDPKLARFQGIFNTFPELNEWPMKDLYAKHPTKENFWLHKGRTDDIIVYHTGEKLNPLAMENIIGSHPTVGAALIAGQGKFQSSLLIEPVAAPANDTEREAFLDAIWPTVEAANKDSPSHAQIHRNMVLFTSADKPMLKAGKGSVQRRLTLDLYEAELEALYAANESTSVTQSNGVKSDAAVDVNSIAGIVRAVTNVDTSLATPDANLFELGLDSLQVTYLARELNRLLSSHGREQSIRPREIYANPFVAALAKHVAAKVEGRDLSEGTETDQVKMQKIYDQLSASLPVTFRQPEAKPSSHAILLTGSTGSLGSYILDTLVRNPQFTQIFCLNRGPDSASRQRQSQESKGLTSSLDKVQFLDADLSRSYFGLDLATYKNLLGTVTSVIHNAWQVDFNLEISSFAPHTTGVRHLIDFSAHSRYAAHIFFVSSIGTVSSLNRITASTAPIPEQIFYDWQVSQPAGYGQSKLVAERLLDASATEAAVPATVFRVGQIAGPTTQAGGWPKQEWLPSLIASSKYLGKLPDSLGQMNLVDWIPVNLLAEVIVDLTLVDASKAGNSTPEQAGASVYHLVDPQSTSWSELLPTVAKNLSASAAKPVEVVPLGEWVEALRQSATSAEDASSNPATKILENYEGLLADTDRPTVLATDRTVQASKTIASIGPVTAAWMENWLKQWAF